jgi:hypothetical protein
MNKAYLRQRVLEELKQYTLENDQVSDVAIPSIQRISEYKGKITRVLYRFFNQTRDNKYYN